MSTQKHEISYYKEINEFLQSFSSGYSTYDPNLYCLRLKENMPDMEQYKPPFKKDFYFIAFVNNAGKTRIMYDNTSVTELNSFLVFQSPGLLYSFFRDKRASGYLLYFKKECFAFLKPDFEKSSSFLICSIPISLSSINPASMNLHHCLKMCLRRMRKQPVSNT